MFNLVKFGMGRLAVLVGMMLVMVGCAGDEGGGGENLTIFGRLSQIVQLGSTEETIAFKIQSEDFFATVRGEVLMNRPAYLKIALTDLDTGSIRDDLMVSVNLCQAIDEQFYGVDACDGSDEAGALYQHELTAVFADGVYNVDGYDWERAGGWAGTITIVDPISAETQTLRIDPDIYPQRPPSSNLFELSNIAIPFAVIGIFLAILFALRGQLMQSVSGYRATAS